MTTYFNKHFLQFTLGFSREKNGHSISFQHMNDLKSIFGSSLGPVDVFCEMFLFYFFCIKVTINNSVYPTS